jgi:hypothetical protein
LIPESLNLSNYGDDVWRISISFFFISPSRASAALVLAAGATNAAATSSVFPASGTVYTGDTIQGKRLLARLTSVGSQRTSGLCRAMSAFGGEAEVARRLPDVA